MTDANLGSDAIDSYFNDSVFVGNSIMLHYKNYVTRRRGSDSGFLGNAKFHASASFRLLQQYAADHRQFHAPALSG